MNNSSNKSMSPSGDSVFNNKSETRNKFANKKESVGSSYEVFRNNTTAVEVIIKQLSNKVSGSSVHEKVNKDSVKNKHELAEGSSKLLNTVELETTRLQNVIIELKKQIINSNAREAAAQMEALSLALENEKLKTTLEYKNNIILKMKKELDNVKKVIKVVGKTMCKAFRVSENLTMTSDCSYKEFEKYLRQELQINNALAESVTKDIFSSDGSAVAGNQRS